MIYILLCTGIRNARVIGSHEMELEITKVHKVRKVQVTFDFTQLV